MPTAIWIPGQGNRDISCPPAGGGSDSPTFQHCKGWNAADVRDIHARMDPLAGSAFLAPDDVPTAARLKVCSVNDTENDLNLALHWWLENLPTSFTTAWNRTSTTLSASPQLVVANDVPSDAYATVDITAWFLDFFAAAYTETGQSFGVSLLGDAGRTGRINIRSRDNTPDLCIRIEVDFTDTPDPSLPVAYKDGDGNLVWTDVYYKNAEGELV